MATSNTSAPVAIPNILGQPNTETVPLHDPTQQQEQQQQQYNLRKRRKDNSRSADAKRVKHSQAVASPKLVKGSSTTAAPSTSSTTKTTAKPTRQLHRESETSGSVADGQPNRTSDNQDSSTETDAVFLMRRAICKRAATSRQVRIAAEVSHNTDATSCTPKTSVVADTRTSKAVSVLLTPQSDSEGYSKLSLSEDRHPSNMDSTSAESPNSITTRKTSKRVTDDFSENHESLRLLPPDNVPISSVQPSQSHAPSSNQNRKVPLSNGYRNRDQYIDDTVDPSSLSTLQNCSNPVHISDGLPSFKNIQIPFMIFWSVQVANHFRELLNLKPLTEPLSTDISTLSKLTNSLYPQLDALFAYLDLVPPKLLLSRSIFFILRATMKHYSSLFDDCYPASEFRFDNFVPSVDVSAKSTSGYWLNPKFSNWLIKESSVVIERIHYDFRIGNYPNLENYEYFDKNSRLVFVLGVLSMVIDIYEEFFCRVWKMVSSIMHLYLCYPNNDGSFKPDEAQSTSSELLADMERILQSEILPQDLTNIISMVVNSARNGVISNFHSGRQDLVNRSAFLTE